MHSRAWHEAGGHAVQELAFTLATAIEYLREMNQRDLDVNTVAPRMRFAMTVGTKFFMEIAKLRALRMLWSRAVAELGGNEDAQKLTLHVRTSLWNKTTRDPHTNILRATVEAFAGALGGCNSMQVGAFDEVVRPPDDFSRRLARNTQLVLQKECHLTRVIDPAGGSWYVEAATADLAARAWGLVPGSRETRRHGRRPARRISPKGRCRPPPRKKSPPPRTAAASSLVSTNTSIKRKRRSKFPPWTCRPSTKRRAQQVASHRTGLEDAENEWRRPLCRVRPGRHRRRHPRRDRPRRPHPRPALRAGRSRVFDSRRRHPRNPLNYEHVS